MSLSIYNCILAVFVLLRRNIRMIAVAIVFIFPSIAFPQCVTKPEEGRWRNLDAKGDPSFIDVNMIGGCGDQVLNGGQTGSSPRYTMTVWITQSTGKLYKQPAVPAAYQLWKNHRWLQGNVSTGGYQDQMSLRVEPHNGQSQLHVFIYHKSLDRKPSAQSEYWFVRSK